MDNEENVTEHKRGYTPPKKVEKANHEKTVTELERRNAHLHPRADPLEEGKKDIPDARMSDQ